MRDLKKIFFVLAVVLGVASTASAVQFQGSASKRTIRVEGKAEATGSIDLTTAVGGKVSKDSIITLDFKTNVLATGITSCTTGAAAGDCTASITVKALDLTDFPSNLKKTVTLTFNADVTFLATGGGRITVKGVRVDATTVTGDLAVETTAAVPATAEPITFIPLAGPLVVASTSSAVKVGVTAATAALLTCIDATAATGPTFTITVDEGFNQGITAGVEEWDGGGAVGLGFGPPGAGTAAVGKNTVVTITFTAVPEKVNITLLSDPAKTKFAKVMEGDVSGTAFGVAADSVLAADVKKTGPTGGGTVKFDITFTKTDTAGGSSAEKNTLVFVVDALKKDLKPGLQKFNAVVTLSAGDSSKGEAPDFGGATVGDKFAFQKNDCASYLLFSWVVSTTGSADGRFNFDTGLAINNTTKDPAVIGTTAQAGAVDLYLFASNGTALGAINLTSSLAAGATTTTTLSQLKAAGSIAGDAAFTSGYAIVVCGFQLGHGFAFISNQTFPFDFTQGYLALNLTSPRIPALAVTESSGH